VTATLARPSAPPPPSSTRRSWSLLALMVAVVATVVWLVAVSPVLGVRTVRVEGARSISVTRIEAVAAVPHGRPLVRVSTAAVERRVERLAQVAAASVTVSYPSTVVIRVTERVAVGFFSAGRTYSLVDRTGRLFQTVRHAPRLPHLVASGAAIDDPATVRTLAAVAVALSPALRKLVTAISADDPNHVTLLLRGGRSAIWGTAERSVQKATVLAALLHRPGTVFDVSDPALVVVR
jgi:cell division protein FtsQ